MRQFVAAVFIALLAGCAASSNATPALPANPGFAAQSRTAAGGLRIAVAPVNADFLRGDATGLRLWGSQAQRVRVTAIDAAGNPAAGASVTVTSEKPKRLKVTAAGGSVYALSAVTYPDASSACPSCKIVYPGQVVLKIRVARNGAQPRTFEVPVAMAHKIVYVSLNPFPNPSFGGDDAVLQYYDDNVRPNVMWDDFDLNNTTAILGVEGLAVGPNGTLYVANSGGLSIPGAVSLYANGGVSSTPSKVLTAPLLGGPRGVAVDARYNVYVSDGLYETVTRFPGNGNAPVSFLNNWPGGSGTFAIAADDRGGIFLAQNQAGLAPSSASAKTPVLGNIVAMRAFFGKRGKPKFQLGASQNNGVNEPYGIAIAADGTTYVVNDYVSILLQPPAGPGPVYSTLTRYAKGIASSGSVPDATVSAGLQWPTAVAVDMAGNVYVGNNEVPIGGSQPAPFFLREYAAGFKSGAKPILNVNLLQGLPAAYRSAFLNVQGIAVYPGPLQH